MEVNGIAHVFLTASNSNAPARSIVAQAGLLGRFAPRNEDVRTHE